MRTTYRFEQDDADNPYEAHTVTYEIVEDGEEFGVDVYVEVPANEHSYGFNAIPRFKTLAEASAWIADRWDRRMPKPEHDDPVLAALFSIRH